MLRFKSEAHVTSIFPFQHIPSIPPKWTFSLYRTLFVFKSKTIIKPFCVVIANLLPS